MKIILILFFLFFSSSVLAEDISDFEIEGMSIGDSALKYFSESEILSNIKDRYKDNKYSYVANDNASFSKDYDAIDFHFLTGDNNYLIQNISGVIYYHNKSISKCHEQMNNIISDIDKAIKNKTKVQDDVYNFSGDATGKSKIKAIAFEIDSGGYIGVQCYDYAPNIEFDDFFEIFIDSPNFTYWLTQLRLQN